MATSIDTLPLRVKMSLNILRRFRGSPNISVHDSWFSNNKYRMVAAQIPELIECGILCEIQRSPPFPSWESSIRLTRRGSDLISREIVFTEEEEDMLPPCIDPSNKDDYYLSPEICDNKDRGGTSYGSACPLTEEHMRALREGKIISITNDMETIALLLAKDGS